MSNTKPRSWRTLRWTTPNLVLPHGLSGAVVFVLGLSITLSSVCGSYTLITDSKERALSLFCAAAFISSLSGFKLSRWARPTTRLSFRVAGAAQMALAWVAWRFRPSQQFATSGAAGPFEIWRTLDLIAAVSILTCIAVVATKSVPQIYRESGLSCLGTGMGCFALALLSVYPFHLAFGGAQWVSCIEAEYPKQLVGFCGYVYVPALWMLATMLFGATLVERKIITPLFFGIFFGAGAFGILATTVLVQEVHIPVVSTQRLLLPCPAPEMNSTFGTAVRLLDTSILAQNLLHRMGVTV